MIKIIGDINFSDGYFDTGFGIGTGIKKGINPFKNLSIDDNDFWMGNFECVCSDSEKPLTPFVISPDILGKIQHLNLYGVANNHSMQIGDRGYDDTLAFLSSRDIKYVGSKSNPTVKFNHQGKLVGVFAFSQRPDNFSRSPLYNHIPEYEQLSGQISQLDECDYKIAFIHWGYEFINYPNIDQKLLAHWLVDQGIDLVVGMHPHVMQGYERYKDKDIFYSLGNAVFKMSWEPTSYGLMIDVDLESTTPKVTTRYLKIDKSGIPSVVDAIPAEYSLSHLNSLISISEENEKYFNNTAQRASRYRNANHKAILKDIVLFRNPKVLDMVGSFIRRRILHR